MTDQHKLSELQHAIMRILWSEGRATVSEVHEALRTERALAPTTVATLLSRMEKKNLVRHHTEGRLFVYEPKVSEQEVRRSMIRDLTGRIFEGDVAAIVGHLLNGREINPGDLARVREMIEEKERELEDQDGE